MARTVPEPSPRGRRRWWRPVGVAVAAAAVLLSSVAAVPARSAETFVVLQMNLCNSGMALTSCYTFGRAVDEAVERIHRHPPELVTLQEVCRDDLYAGDGWGKLARAMADRYGSGHITVGFVPAVNSDTGDWYRCTNGQPFGDALIHHGDGRELHDGWYANQDSTNEVRAWICATVIKDRLTGCTTHLSTEPDVAARQCRELVSILAAPWVLPEVVVAGDFNLRFAPGRPHDVAGCAFAGAERRDDNALQDVFFSGSVGWVGGGYEGMRWTDHPLLYERLRV